MRMWLMNRKRWPPLVQSRKTHKSGSFLSGSLEKVGLRYIGKRLIILEIAMRSKTPSVNNALRYSFMIEVENLFAKVKVFKCSWPAGTDLQRILIIGYGSTLLRGQHGPVAS